MSPESLQCLCSEDDCSSDTATLVQDTGKLEELCNGEVNGGRDSALHVPASCTKCVFWCSCFVVRREILKSPMGLCQCSKHLVNRYQTPSGCEVSSWYLGYLKCRVSLLKSCSVICKAEFKIVQSTRGLVWELGAVSALLKPASPPLQFVYCQVCCEPFHKFCLEESERPQEDQLENWCCRRCKFCHVCGRQHQATKVP